MKVKEYLKAIGVPEDSSIELVFNIAKYDKEERCMVYRMTPIRNIWTWSKSNMMNYIILNTTTYQPAWISGVNWNPSIKHNRLMALLVISETEFYGYYQENQADDIIRYIDRVIEGEIKDGNYWKENIKRI